MGCPVHIWVPMMAAMAPFARMARDRFLPARPRTPGGNARHREVRVVQRFAPIAQRSTDGAGAMTSTEQAR